MWFKEIVRNIYINQPGVTEWLENGVISVSQLLITGNLCAGDKAMDELSWTLLSSGVDLACFISGGQEKYGAYNQWVHASSARGRFSEQTLEVTGIVINLTDQDLKSIDIS